MQWDARILQATPGAGKIRERPGMSDFRRREEGLQDAAERRFLAGVNVALWVGVGLLLWWSP